ncbi:MAG: DUF1800 family protein [Saprospiraceae bacterium]|nr:DUF1800 family protein [Saprospiraceae bacterium]
MASVRCTPAKEQAMALSLFVVSDKSAFGSRTSYALVELLKHVTLNNALPITDLMEDVTFHPAMGVYLTFLNNPKSNPATNQFPDENYARELMQLFTIGTSKLNMDGSQCCRNQRTTSTNIQQYRHRRICKGVYRACRGQIGPPCNRSAANDTSYTLPMIMFNSSHETV